MGINKNWSYATYVICKAILDSFFSLFQSLNEILESADAPLEVTEGFIQSISLSVPWGSLLQDNCALEVKGLEMVFKPRPRLSKLRRIIDENKSCLFNFLNSGLLGHPTVSTDFSKAAGWPPTSAHYREADTTFFLGRLILLLWVSPTAQRYHSQNFSFLYTEAGLLIYPCMCVLWLWLNICWRPFMTKHLRLISSFLASGSEPMYWSSFMTSSMQLAKECLSQKLTDEQGEGSQPFEGLEKFAETIETGTMDSLSLQSTISRCAT